MTPQSQQDRLREVFFCLSETKGEIAQIQEMTSDINKSGFVSIFQRLNKERGLIEIGASAAGEFPMAMRRNTKAIIGDLRSQLDHLVAIALDADEDAKRTPYFPIGRSKADWARALDTIRKSKAPQFAIDSFARAEAFPEGSALLVELNWLANKAKHVRLTGLASHSGGFDVQGLDIDSPEYFAVRTPNWDPRKREIILMEMTEGTKIDSTVRIYMSPVLCNSKLLNKTPLAMALTQIHDAVLNVVRDFDKSLAEHLRDLNG